ncbi:glycosyltransferase family 8 protein [Candidatus Saccharibacteria bacterium]|nr:glycosyltransferase family 8 protein [Candidatus Saccharibacteria bacterium]
MNILYCGDKGINRGVLVSILSILKHNKNALSFYILTINYEDTKAFTEKSAKYLDSLVKKTNSKSFVKLIDATDVFVKNLPKKNMGSYFTPCSMLRLYIDKIPEIARLDRVLYLDYDVVCRGDLSEFYDMNLTNIEAVGVLDIYGRRWYHYHGLFKQDYMNSGVMLFNMPECLKTNMFERAASLCAERWMMLADQAALNKTIEKRKLIDRKYNEQEERPREDTVLHHFSNNFKFWPYFRVQKVKPFEIDKIHNVLKITEYDDILDEYDKLKENL